MGQIQSATKEAVEAIRVITGTIEEVSEDHLRDARVVIAEVALRVAIVRPEQLRAIRDVDVAMHGACVVRQ